MESKYNKRSSFKPFLTWQLNGFDIGSGIIYFEEIHIFENKFILELFFDSFNDGKYLSISLDEVSMMAKILYSSSILRPSRAAGVKRRWEADVYEWMNTMRNNCKIDKIKTSSQSFNFCSLELRKSRYWDCTEVILNSSK